MYLCTGGNEAWVSKGGELEETCEGKTSRGKARLVNGSFRVYVVYILLLGFGELESKWVSHEVQEAGETTGHHGWFWERIRLNLLTHL